MATRLEPAGATDVNVIAPQTPPRGRRRGSGAGLVLTRVNCVELASRMRQNPDRDPGVHPESDITTLLGLVREGDGAAEAELFARVQEDLKRRAGRLLHGQRQVTLETAALVNEAYLRLAGRSCNWRDRAHFFAVAARAMRCVLVDHARRRQRAKRGGDGQAIPLDDLLRTYEHRGASVLDLDDALSLLAKRDKRAARVVEMRFFGGLALPEIAQTLDVGLRTVERDWEFARAWLHRELS